MEVEVMGRGGRNVEGEGKEGGGAKPPNFEMEWCFPDRHESQAGAKYHASRSLRNPRSAPESDTLKADSKKLVLIC